MTVGFPQSRILSVHSGGRRASRRANIAIAPEAEQRSQARSAQDSGRTWCTCNPCTVFAALHESEAGTKRSLAGTRRPAKGQKATSLRHLGTIGSRIRNSLLCGHLHSGSKLSDEFARSLAVIGDVVERLLNFFQIQRSSAQPV